MGLITRGHFEQWKRRDPSCPILYPLIQCGDEKRKRIFRLFQSWAQTNGHASTLAPYLAASKDGARELRLIEDNDLQHETFLQTRFHRAGQTEARKKQIQKKLNKTPDLVVFVLTGEDTACSECGQAIETGDLLYRETDDPFCLSCADFDHLKFLPSGNATLTRDAPRSSVRYQR